MWGRKEVVNLHILPYRDCKDPFELERWIRELGPYLQFQAEVSTSEIYQGLVSSWHLDSKSKDDKQLTVTFVWLYKLCRRNLKGEIILDDWVEVKAHGKARLMLTFEWKSAYHPKPQRIKLDSPSREVARFFTADDAARITFKNGFPTVQSPIKRDSAFIIFTKRPWEKHDNEA